jgi:hypothetical protein
MWLLANEAENVKAILYWQAQCSHGSLKSKLEQKRKLEHENDSHTFDILICRMNVLKI